MPALSQGSMQVDTSASVDGSNSMDAECFHVPLAEGGRDLCFALKLEPMSFPELWVWVGWSAETMQKELEKPWFGF